jgi:UDP-glucose 4-epimerase
VRVLVTGGLGKIGRHVVAELAERHELVVLDRGLPPEPIARLPRPGPRYVRGDVTDLGTVYGLAVGVDAIVHLAAIPNARSDPADVVFRTNVMGTFNAAEAAATLGVGRLVYAASGSALGFAFRTRPIVPEYMPIDEEHPLRPQDPYALSKMVGEEIVRSVHRRTGMTTVCIRPPYVVAPEEYAEAIPRRLDDPRLAGLFAYVDARDLARAFRLALEGDLSGHETFYVTADDALAREPLATLFPRYFPGSEAAAAPLTGSDGPISSARARRVLGYRPQHSWRQHVAAGARAGG